MTSCKWFNIQYIKMAIYAKFSILGVSSPVIKSVIVSPSFHLYAQEMH